MICPGKKQESEQIGISVIEVHSPLSRGPCGPVTVQSDILHVIEPGHFKLLASPLPHAASTILPLALTPLIQK